MTLYIYLYLSDTCQSIAQHMSKVWLIWPNKEKTIHHFIWGAIACHGLALHTQSYDVYAMQEIMYKHVGIYVLLDAICYWSLRWDIRGCQNGMQGPQLFAKPCHFWKLNMATSRMAFLDLNPKLYIPSTLNIVLILWHT